MLWSRKKSPSTREHSSQTDFQIMHIIFVTVANGSCHIFLFVLILFHRQK